MFYSMVIAYSMVTYDAYAYNIIIRMFILKTNKSYALATIVFLLVHP